MNNLINITTNEQGSQVVSARELHEFLEVNSNFTEWMGRMIGYGFEEDVDYVTFSEKRNRQTLKQYAITLDMAKELSMIQRSEKGKQARKYFIESEKQLKAIRLDSYMIDDPEERALAWIKERKEVALQLEAAETKVKQAKKAKGRISSSREASVMAKLGVLKRENEKLKTLKTVNKKVSTSILISNFEELRIIGTSAKKVHKNIKEFVKQAYNKAVPSTEALFDLLEINGYGKKDTDDVGHYFFSWDVKSKKDDILRLFEEVKKQLGDNESNMFVF